MEHTSPEYPGAFGPGEELPVDAQVAEVLRARAGRSGGGDGCMRFAGDPRTAQHPIRHDDCDSSPRGEPAVPVRAAPVARMRGAWSASERRLFEEIARRLEDALDERARATATCSRSEEELRRSSRAYLAEAQNVEPYGQLGLEPGFKHHPLLVGGVLSHPRARPGKGLALVRAADAGRPSRRPPAAHR